MKVIKVMVECTRCGYEWWTRGARKEACPACSKVNPTGWSRQLEEREIARV